MELDEIANAIGDLYLIPIFVYVIYALKYTVNYMDVSDLEKKFMTSFKKLTINLSIVLSVSIFITLFLYSAMNNSTLGELSSASYQGDVSIEDKAYKSNDEESSKESTDGLSDAILLLVGLFIVSFLFLYAVFLLAEIFWNLYKPKKEYYFTETIGDNEERKEIKWYIKRYNEDSGLLIESIEGKQKFLDDWSNKEVEYEIIEGDSISTRIKKNLRRATLIHLRILFVVLLLTILSNILIDFGVLVSVLEILMIAYLFVFMLTMVSLLVLFCVHFQRFKNQIKEIKTKFTRS